MIDYCQLIGTEALRLAGDPQAKILIYAEVEDGAISCDLFFNSPSTNEVQFRFGPPEMQKLVYEYWRAGQGQVKPESWAVLSFVVSGGKFIVNHEYPDQLNPDEDLPERRPRAVEKYFPNISINYSKPKG